MAVAARPGDAAGRGVYRGDPVAADVVRDWGDTSELPPAFDDGGLLTAATFAPPADAVSAVLLQAVAGRPEPSGTGLAKATASLGSKGSAGDTRTTEAQPRPSEHPSGSAAARGSTCTAAEANGLAALPTVAGVGRAAGDPFDPTGNVAVAVGRALAEAGVGLDAVDDIAVVEHDAATVELVAGALGVGRDAINRSGGAVATGNAAAAEELRLITDGLAGPGTGRQLLTISAGPTGSAAIVWHKRI